MIKFKELTKLKYHEQIKEFNKIAITDLTQYINDSSKAVDKKLLPIIKFNYPNLLMYLDKEQDYNKGFESLQDKIDDEQFNRKVFNKEYSKDDIDKLIVERNVSKRRVGVIAKVYPHLYKNCMPDADNYLYSKILMAIELDNKDYLIKNIAFIKENIKHDEKIKVLLRRAYYLYPYLDKDSYSDEDVLSFINTNKEMAQYLKDDINIIKYWQRWNTTEFNSINSKTLLNYAIDNNLEIHDLCIKIAKQFSSVIMQKYPYYFDFYNTHFSHLCTKTFNLNALKDPYNLLHMNYHDKELQREFIKQSNNNLYDAMYVVANIEADLSYFLNEFNDIHTAITTYPVLSYYVDKKHLTPYVYNLMTTLDARVFEYI